MIEEMGGEESLFIADADYHCQARERLIGGRLFPRRSELGDLSTDRGLPFHELVIGASVRPG